MELTPARLQGHCPPQQQPQPSQHEPRKRQRPRVAFSILEDFRKKNPDVEPNNIQIQILLERIKALPDCQDFTDTTVRQWFKRRRKRVSELREAIVNPSVSPYPTLTPSSITLLTTLSQNQPDPPTDLITAWATLLVASEDDIRAWLRGRQGETSQPDGNTISQRLPTPSDSISSEPSLYSPAASYDEIQFIPRPTVPHSPQLNVNLCQQEDSRNKPEEVTLPNQPPVSIASSLTQLHFAILDSLEKPETSTSVPTNSAEFALMFSPYAEKMEKLMKIL